MAANQKRRQKQLERKKVKRKERHKLLVKQKNRGLAEQLSEAAVKAPILDSLIMGDLWDQGLGQVIVSRELPDRRVAMACFLVDRYCLGVKDAFAKILSKGEYEDDYISRLESRFELVAVAPAAARKLVEGAVEYAQSLGLNPHADYHRAKAIFGDIDPSTCDDRFEFGKDGQPLFVAGPHDTPDRCYRILSTLEHTCGRDGFHYLMPLMDDLPESQTSRTRRLIDVHSGEELEPDNEFDDADE